MSEATSSDRISAVIPSYNRRDRIAATIDSVLGQVSVPEEILVVDDGSSDGTPEFLRERYGDRIQVVVHERNLGVSAARRTGYRKASGEWIAYLDSDDRWPSATIARYRELIRTCRPGTTVVFGDITFVARGGVQSGHLRDKGHVLDAPQTAEDARAWVYPVLLPFFQASLIRRSALCGADVFREGLRIGEDSLAFAQLSTIGPFVMIPDQVCFMDRDDGRSSSLSKDELKNPDFPRSRMLLLEVLNRSGQGPFCRADHEGWVRGWIRARLSRGESVKPTEGFQQFRFGWSAKSLAFCALQFLPSRTRSARTVGVNG